MKRLGQIVKPSELEKNDLFYTKYGFTKRIFRVRRKLGDDIIAQPQGRCSSIIIGNETTMKYAGRTNWFKALFF